MLPPGGNSNSPGTHRSTGLAFTDVELYVKKHHILQSKVIKADPTRTNQAIGPARTIHTYSLVLMTSRTFLAQWEDRIKATIADVHKVGNRPPPTHAHVIGRRMSKNVYALTPRLRREPAAQAEPK